MTESENHDRPPHAGTNRLSDITVLLDRTGSMSSVKQQTISGYNEFLTGQRVAPGRATMTLIQFDTQNAHELCGAPATPIMQAPNLTEETYQPRSTTPLWDALGLAIHSTDVRLKSLGDADFPDDVIFVVITDGYENASREYRNDQVLKLVTEREINCGWKFIYLGADIDAFGQGSIGSNRARSASISKTKMDTALHMTSNKVHAYRESGNVQDLIWTTRERKAMSDDES